MACSRSGSVMVQGVIVPDAGHDLVDDVGGIFAAWIVTGNDDDVGGRGGLAHQGAFVPVTVSAGSEHADQSPRRDRSQRRQGVPQGIICVCVVDEDRKRLAAFNPFEASGDDVDGFETSSNLRE